MGIIGGALGYRLLRLIQPHERARGGEISSSCRRRRIEALFGSHIWSELTGKVVIDFGCGAGENAIEIAHLEATSVIGLDIRESVLNQARQAAEAAGVAQRCSFTTTTRERADVILSMASFEHFEDPGRILHVMRGLLKDDGSVMIAFVPWCHPFGGHLFSVFPWAHLLFTEKALIRWRSHFKSDGATRFAEVEGGLNQMTIRRFEALVHGSQLALASFDTIPIGRLRLISQFLPREFFTAIVRCRLVPRQKINCPV